MDFATLAAYANIFTAVIATMACLYYAHKWRAVVWRMAMCLTAVTICAYTAVSYIWILRTATPLPNPPPLNVVLLYPPLSLWHTFIVAILIAMEIREESMIDIDCRKRVIELERTLTNKIQAIQDRDYVIHALREKLEANTEKTSGAN